MSNLCWGSTSTVSLVTSISMTATAVTGYRDEESAAEAERTPELGGVVRQGLGEANHLDAGQCCKAMWAAESSDSESGGEIKESPVVGPDLEFTISVRVGGLSLIEKQGHKRDSSE